MDAVTQLAPTVGVVAACDCLGVARDIQSWPVPKSPPQLPDLDIAFSTRPANTVAGDYFDVVSMPAAGGARPAFLFVAADAAARGIPAGLLMGSSRAYLHALAVTAVDLGSPVAGLDRFRAADCRAGT